MGIFTDKISEENMCIAIGGLMQPGENPIAMLYCGFKDTGFFASNITKYGYAAITDCNRFVGYRIEVFGSQLIEGNLEDLKKIKISNSLFSQKIVYLEFDNESKTRVKFMMFSKILGSNFPNQNANYMKMLELLGNYIR